MDVDRSAGGHPEHGLRQDLPERHNDSDLGRVLGEPVGPAGIAEPVRLEHGDPLLEGNGLDRRTLDALAPTGGAVRIAFVSAHVPVLVGLNSSVRFRVASVSTVGPTSRNPLSGPLVGSAEAFATGALDPAS